MINNKRVKLTFFLAACVSSLLIILVFFFEPSDFLSYVISIASVLVTFLLGIETYHQTDVQNKIEMIDKIPYFVVENFKSTRDCLEYENLPLDLKCFEIDPSDSIEITFRNVCDIHILETNLYTVTPDGKKIQFTRKTVQDELLNKFVSYGFESSIETVKPLIDSIKLPNLYSVSEHGTVTYLLNLNTDFNRLIAGENITNVIALEHRTIYGYNYTQFIKIGVKYIGNSSVNSSLGMCAITEYKTFIVDSDLSSIPNKKLSQRLHKEFFSQDKK